MPIGTSDGKTAFFRYLTWSEEDERWQIVCTDAGHSEIGPGTPYPPNKNDHPGQFKSVAADRTLNEYQIVYVTKGRGIFQTGGLQHVVLPGSIIVLFPGVSHFYKPDLDVGWSEYWVGFKGSHADTLCREGFLSPARPFFEVGLQNGILSLYTQIFDLVRNQEPLYQLKAGALILGLAAEILACERSSAQATHSEKLVAKAKFLMEENVDGEINLNGIGDALGASTSHLNEVFKSYTSMTPYQYFISIKIGRAKELLERDLPVKEVAFSLGFSDEYYFSRLFKSKTGISPSHWKNYVRQ
ncbi:MAG: AraC family transcriptional regulator [Spirochaetes bacterium]|nr:AraC family transcriptional regulator [Spirochaetota bacterium]